MDERLKFAARLLDGERMTTVCKEFGISRKTGYKIFKRYKDVGLDGLKDRNRRPQRQANRMPFQIERTTLQLKRDHPSWGALKLREKQPIGNDLVITREFCMVSVAGFTDANGKTGQTNTDTTISNHSLGHLFAL